jgi:hypothetical protein
MRIYNTEMDGFSLVKSKVELCKGDFALIDSHVGEGVYKVSSIIDEKVSFSLVKYLTPVEFETNNRFIIDGVEHSFVNRPSKNQMILIGNDLHKVESIAKETKEIITERVVTKEVKAQYAVYDRDLYNSRRENRWQNADRIFDEWGEALGYIMNERSSGRKVSF